MFFSKTAISILVISNHNSFRELFDKIASVYLLEKYIYILPLEMASAGNRHCANFIGTLLFPTLISQDRRRTETANRALFRRGSRKVKVYPL